MDLIDNINYSASNDIICLDSRLVPWDTLVFGFPVAEIASLTIKNPMLAQEQFNLFKQWVNDNGFKLISSRLPDGQMVESMFLQRNNFRFVEMVCQPYLRDLQSYEILASEMAVDVVEETELSLIINMAEKAFEYERYHVDPRCESYLADLRYANWVKSSFNSSNQTLLKVFLKSEIIGFFIIEYKDKSSVYWHLTAVNPLFRKKRIGYEVWMTMLNYHKCHSIKTVLTTISMRNLPVLNLYTKLGFRFTNSSITHHWHKLDD
ncbi:GNAT family N-acetyltransferase [Legionella impletisoli]|uniref:N-acetyltransferase domain-containing protein n=1 Tax=Legionella impletisoli TaxID=343510 RepID=A0A917NA06_9GAMM|nr:GNAT family N-acetyltransferase [Legionella impletisoli]GGI82027.1 hypothetical protein GCM10007966_08240 [Legionella impletisoli]